MLKSDLLGSIDSRQKNTLAHLRPSKKTLIYNKERSEGMPCDCYRCIKKDPVRIRNNVSKKQMGRERTNYEGKRNAISQKEYIEDIAVLIAPKLNSKQLIRYSDNNPAPRALIKTRGDQVDRKG